MKQIAEMKNLIPLLVLSILTIISISTFSGCELLDKDGEEPFESMSFKYVYALPAEGSGYTITDPDGNTCSGVPANVSLTLLAGVIQNKTDFYDDMVSCGGTFLVAGNAVQAVKNDGLNFRYRTTGSNNDAIILTDRLTIDDTNVDPSGINITTSGGLTVGTPTTLGFAEINYILPSRNFQGENGGPVWSQNTNHQNATFFEIELTSQTNDRAEGFFQCIARNQTDTNDGRLLLVLDGAFSMVIR